MARSRRTCAGLTCQTRVTIEIAEPQSINAEPNQTDDAVGYFVFGERDRDARAPG
jgi:hypothetical protein